MDLVSQNLLLSSGGKKDSTYVDDVFSTYLYKGSSSSGSGPAQTITNGVDVAGEGGLVWLKSRNANNENALTDTVTGAGKRLQSDSNTSQSTSTESVSGFTNSGFTLPGGWNPMVNASNQDYVSWTFRKEKGFFDIVTYTGNGSSQNISHNLGTIPGCIMVKNTSASNDHWAVYHRDLDVSSNDSKAYRLRLDETAARATDLQTWNYTDPTSTHFSVGQSDETNENGSTMVAYLFAGGASDEPGAARSVDFDGSGDELKVTNSYSDFQFGTGDFTVEVFVKYDEDPSSSRYIIDMRSSAGTANAAALAVGYSGDNSKIEWTIPGSTILQVPWADYLMVGAKTWNHIAVARSVNTIKMFINGTEVGSTTDNTNYIDPTDITIGDRYSNSDVTQWFNGNISNVRIVKGTAVYTSAFRPPTAGLAAITNTKLLCCNKNTVTGSTVTPGTITSNGNPQSSTYTPFDDPGGFKFGEEGDQNIIKCGSYVGKSGANKVYLGWEPQWLIVKNLDSVEPWVMVDNMRRWTNESSGAISLKANSTSNESTYNNWGPTATGWELDLNNAEIDQNEKKYIYIAIRRSDGLAGKPAEAGTDAFAMDTGAGSSTIPNFDSGFPVDLSLIRNPTGSASWWAGTRLTQGTEIKVNGIDVPVSWQYGVYDSNVGWQNYSGHGSSEMSWMWKRHAGFDVVTYKGNGSTFRNFNHSLGRTPEMMWVRGRGPNQANWYVYHKDLDNANRRNLKLENIDGQSSESTGNWNDTFPTATHFTVGVNANNNGDRFVTMLFASVDGISKVGSYIGNASASGPTINLGFAPRFILIKCKTASTNWFVYDTLRGLTSGNDQRLILNSTGNQTSADDIDPTATGFQVVSTWDQLNDNNTTYTYYAHA